MFKLSKSQTKDIHSITTLKDDELIELYHYLPETTKWKDEIRQHFIDCVTDEQLLDAGITSAEEYVDNFLATTEELRQNADSAVSKLSRREAKYLICERVTTDVGSIDRLYLPQYWNDYDQAETKKKQLKESEPELTFHVMTVYKAEA